MAEARAPASEFRRYWIFQGMPDRYDLEERLRPGETEAGSSPVMSKTSCRATASTSGAAVADRCVPQ